MKHLKLFEELIDPFADEQWEEEEYGQEMIDIFKNFLENDDSEISKELLNNGAYEDLDPNRQ